MVGYRVLGPRATRPLRTHAHARPHGGGMGKIVAFRLDLRNQKFCVLSTMSHSAPLTDTSGPVSLA
eukprot:6941693-Prymnesium_polylepis.1